MCVGVYVKECVCGGVSVCLKVGAYMRGWVGVYVEVCGCEYLCVLAEV